MEQTNDYKEYWNNIELVPSQKEDKQLPFLIDTLKEELDINKIETVLEIGVGYGRVAKAILDTFPNIELYDGADISSNALKQSVEYLKRFHPSPYYAIPLDFEDWVSTGLYDLIISVETMSIVPGAYNICTHWIDKMISLSKKYVVNLDFTRGNDTITNNPPHDYQAAYASMDLIRFREIPIVNNESIFICYVR